MTEHHGMSDKELASRALLIRATRGVKKLYRDIKFDLWSVPDINQGPTPTGMSMDEVMGTEFTCERCRPKLMPGKITRRLKAGSTCKGCGRQG